MDDDQDPIVVALHEQVTPSIVDQLRAVDDPIERSQRARLVVEELGRARDKIAALRKNSLVEANDAGTSWAEIGRLIGTSAGRAYQIVHGKNR